MKQINFTIIAFLLISIIAISGCSSDTEYTPPSKAESTPSEVNTPSEPQEVAPPEPEAEPEPPKIQTFKTGETATDDELKVTVNSVNFVSKIDQQDNEFLIAGARANWP